MDKISLTDMEDGKNYSVSELISFLKSSFQTTDFEKVEQILRLREEKMKLDKEGLEDEIKRRYSEGLKWKETVKREVGLEEELDVCVTKYHELFAELENKKMEFVAVEDKFRDLEFRKISVDDELKEYKRTCNRLQEQIMRLEEDKKVICEREKRAEERSSCLEEEIKKIESDKREKYVQFKTEIRDSECGKRRAEDEIEVWKKRFRELETRVLRMEGENSTLRCIESHVSGKRELEPGALQNEVSYNDEGKKDRNKTSEHQSENGGTKEKKLNRNEKIIASTFVGSNHPSPLRGNRDVHAKGPASINMQCEPLVNFKEEKNNTPLGSKVEFGYSVKKQLDFELEGSAKKKIALLDQGSVRPVSRGIIDISDSEDENEISPKYTCNIGGKEMVHVSTNNTLERSSDNEKYLTLTSKKCLKRPCSDQKSEEYGSGCEEDIPRSSTPKRKRASKIVTSESESEDDDRIPIGRLKMKNLEELNKEVHKLSPVNLCAGNVTQSSGGQNVEESITPAKRRLISLRQCEEKKSLADRTSPNHLEMGGKSQQKAGNPTDENDEENVAEEIGSDSEGESLGGFIVNGSDSSDSGDSCSDPEDPEDMGLAFDQVLAMIRRNRDKESKWQFEADMLSSFEEDPELCMKAVCALYRQQTSEEKSMKGSLHLNNRGFNKFDALRGTVLAEFLMDGDREGDLKKSFKELEKFDPKALEECKRLARHYSKQLFNIYQNKEDPFFLPSSTSR
ncbi:hypothetical protein BVC80_8981g31 [Macleaya cordata]|uniref:Uncharacterized protein n=1 Tax=Macleaya cordata TaxID=56857 RepID=A0A200Q7D6_MACCD|nr:hypothetical protein BVC80_8981g31 [Macleaya cordata]